MKTFLKQSAGRLLPPKLMSVAQLQRERMRLNPVAQQVFAPAELRSLTREHLQQIFSDADIERAWRSDRALIESVMPFEDIDGGVCPGERRAIYYLVAALKPRRILEVGTHIGASTLAIAQALSTHAERSGHLTTVDIIDVNDPAQGAFVRCGTRPPRENLRALGLDSRVTFVAQPALSYLNRHEPGFDLVFLDGDHSASAVYLEIAAALGRLSRDAIILLHDFYPDGRRLYAESMIEPGPFVAAERIAAECLELSFLSFPDLPWETKQGVHHTSLAAVVAQPAAH